MKPISIRAVEALIKRNQHSPTRMQRLRDVIAEIEFRRAYGYSLGCDDYEEDMRRAE